MACFILPSFHPKEKEVETKGTQTKALIWEFAKTKTGCVGCLDGVEFPGIEFGSNSLRMWRSAYFSQIRMFGGLDEQSNIT